MVSLLLFPWIGFRWTSKRVERTNDIKENKNEEKKVSDSYVDWTFICMRHDYESWLLQKHVVV